MIAYATGRTGNLGSAFPSAVLPLHTRLESPLELMINELSQSHIKPDVIIHSAALVPVQRCAENPELAFELNVEGSARWFKAAAAVGVKRFIYVSTSHVFRPTEKLEFLQTTATPDPVSVYGKSKLEGERRLCEIAASSPGTELLIVRVFSLLSRARRPGFLYSEMLKRAESGDRSPIMGMRNIRDFIFAEDACRRILQIAEADSASGTFHVCTGKPQTVGELAENVFASVGARFEGIVEDQSTLGSPRNCLVGAPTFLPGENEIALTSVSGKPMIIRP